MAFFDLPLSKLQEYRPARQEAADFDAFWEKTLKEARKHPLKPVFKPVSYGLKTLDSYDVTFPGYAGQPIKGWYLRPHGAKGRLPCVVEYIGYGGGRGFPTDWMIWASSGFAHLIMDTRGQGSSWRKGDTPDFEPEGSSPSLPGFMTRGVLDPKTYYYRRVFTDAVRALDTALSRSDVDPSRIAVAGGSQGGGITLAVAGLHPKAAAALPDVPFLCHYRRATEIVDSQPYREISQYCQTHRDKVERVFQTLSYFDGVNFSARARAKALFSVGLMDETCPPSTVYAAYNHYAGDKDIRVWSYNHHEGGDSYQVLEKIKFLQSLWV